MACFTCMALVMSLFNWIKNEIFNILVQPMPKNGK